MAIPIYLEIVDKIKEEIKKGNIKPGEIIKSENTLCEEFGVSRMTIRKSFSVLANEGYLYSVPGKGYYVSEHNLDQYVIYYNEISNIEKVTQESQMMGVSIIKRDIDVMVNLQLSENKYVIAIKRILINEDKPIAYDIKYIPYYKGIPIVEKEIRFSTFPEMVARKKSLFAIRKELKIKSVISNDELNKVLGLTEISPLLLVEQKLFDEKNKPIGWGLTYYVGDSFQIDAESSLNNKNSTIF